jgi:hypothetical protein
VLNKVHKFKIPKQCPFIIQGKMQDRNIQSKYVYRRDKQIVKTGKHGGNTDGRAERTGKTGKADM